MNKVNEDYFKTWTHNMAYVFGLWCADGYISQKGGFKFAIGLKESDRYLLEAIKKDMGLEAFLIREEGPSLAKSGVTCMYRLTFHSKILVEDILQLGGNYNKTWILSFPKIPAPYLSDFVRGYFDGDGTISVTSNGIGCSICSVSKRFLETLKIELEKTIDDFNCSIAKETTTLWKLWFSQNNARRLAQFMYSSPSTLFLYRKYNKFLEGGKQILFGKKGSNYVHINDIYDKQDFIGFLERGLTIREIALRIGSHHNTVAHQLKRYGIDWENFRQQRPSHKPLQKDVDLRLKELTPQGLKERLLRGETASFIGKLYGVDHQTIRGRCRKWGLDYKSMSENRNSFVEEQRKRHRQSKAVLG